MRILSLFDGMSCGMLSFLNCGVDVSDYVAYEIDKFAVQTSKKNFPSINHKGNVFDADFNIYKNFDFLIGGSPCTYWSIAKGKGREVEASGLGWELFSQYVRCLNESKPNYFIYENNYSMSKDVKESISNAFGFEPIVINSSLFSAQNRKRLYWVGVKNKFGDYSKIYVPQTKDRCIVIKDILDDFAEDDKYRSSGTVCLNSKSIIKNNKMFQPSLQDRIYSIFGKSTAITTSFHPSIAYKSINNIENRYAVKNGLLYMENKCFPINLIDGFYTVRKFSILETKRLQTVPDSYVFPVSDSQAFKMLGNGWTVDVISHLINSCITGKICCSIFD